jgi:hypothetical protein
MAILTDIKQELATIVSEVIPTFPYIPERLNPGNAIIFGGSPYLQSGNTFRSFVVTLNIDVAFAPQSNENEVKLLDDTVSSIVELLINNQYGVSQVSQPFAMETNNATYLAVRIELTTTVIIN